MTDNKLIQHSDDGNKPERFCRMNPKNLHETEHMCHVPS